MRPPPPSCWLSSHLQQCAESHGLLAVPLHLVLTTTHPPPHQSHATARVSTRPPSPSLPRLRHAGLCWLVSAACPVPTWSPLLSASSAAASASPVSRMAPCSSSDAYLARSSDVAKMLPACHTHPPTHQRAPGRRMRPRPSPTAHAPPGPVCLSPLTAASWDSSCRRLWAVWSRLAHGRTRQYTWRHHGNIRHPPRLSAAPVPLVGAGGCGWHLEHGGDEVGADEQRPPGDGRRDEGGGRGLVQRVQTVEVPPQHVGQQARHRLQLRRLNHDAPHTPKTPTSHRSERAS